MSRSKRCSTLPINLKAQNTVDMFATYADRHGLQRRNLMIKEESFAAPKRYKNGRIIYNMLVRTGIHTVYQSRRPCESRQH
jgi:carboxyl-terminal processing protease